MRYAELTDIQNPAFGLPAKAWTGVSSPELQKALEEASNYADGFLARVYVLPLTLWGNDLKSAICHIASYHLLAGRGFAPNSGTSDEHVRLRYEDALRWLKMVSRREIYPQGIEDSSLPSEDTNDDFGTPEIVSATPRNWR